MEGSNRTVTNVSIVDTKGVVCRFGDFFAQIRSNFEVLTRAVAIRARCTAYGDVFFRDEKRCIAVRSTAGTGRMSTSLYVLALNVVVRYGKMIIGLKVDSLLL